MNETSNHPVRVVHQDDDEGVRLLHAIARRRNCTVPGAIRMMVREEAARLGLVRYGEKHPQGGEPRGRTDSRGAEGEAAGVATPYRRVALVSRNYRLAGGSGRWDLSDDYAAINDFCDGQGCDTILYALWTWDRGSPGSHAPDFAALRNVKRVFLEESSLGEPQATSIVVGWIAGSSRRDVLQRFARSVDGARDKQRFLDDLEEGNRTVGAGVVAVCGETNIISTGANADPFGFLPWLAGEQENRGTNVLLNPIHNFMKRREMTEKRRLCSAQGYRVLSVWNWGRWDVTGKREPKVPWTFYDKGQDRTATVQTASLPSALRPDLRIGIVDL